MKFVFIDNKSKLNPGYYVEVNTVDHEFCIHKRHLTGPMSEKLAKLYCRYLERTRHVVDATTDVTLELTIWNRVKGDSYHYDVTELKHFTCDGEMYEDFNILDEIAATSKTFRSINESVVDYRVFYVTEDHNKYDIQVEINKEDLYK